MNDRLIPNQQQIYRWIEEVYGHGVRRPGYGADRWAEVWLQERFQAFGLQNVRAEPVELPYWQPRSASLSVTVGEETLDVPCFPLPHTAPVIGLTAPLVSFEGAPSEALRGGAALCDVPLNRVPHTVFKGLAKWTYDPHETFDNTRHILPFGRQMQHVMEPAIDAGAAAFIGTLIGYPGDSHDYYVPYDAVERPIPGVWVSGSDGERIRALMTAGNATARISVDAARETITCYNIVGELPGADDDMVIIGSHHDGPWASAVEDGSGMALVLAQVAYWSQIPSGQRPHRLVFLLNAGHMGGGAGQQAFVETHRTKLERVVLEVHLEHAANEFSDEGGELRPTGQPEARWWFTSEIAALETAVQSAIEAEELGRSYMLRPTTFGDRPTTDAAAFHLARVPIVNYLTAPFYLFDSMDTLDKIHRPSLVPVTRAAIRLVEWTAGRSAASMRT